MGSSHVPSTCVKSTAETPLQHSSKKKIEDVVTVQNSPPKQHPNRDSGATKETSQRTATNMQEVVRNPCGPSPQNNANLQGHVGVDRREKKPVIEPVVKQVASPTSIDRSFANQAAEVPTIPVPTKPYTSFSTSRTQKVQLAVFCGIDWFFLSPSDISSHVVSFFSLPLCAYFLSNSIFFF